MILVTGSSGHLGEALVRTLRGTGRPVRGIDRLASPYTDVVGSITDLTTVERAFAGVTAVVHTATLHKPHVATHARQDFIDVNVTGTLTLLEAAARHRVASFIYTSTTSTFGDALVPAPGEPAAWITEDLAPVPKNIYGVTKVAAEDLCTLAHRNQKLPVVILRTSRFFPEEDDEPTQRATYDDANLKTTELLYRRLDLSDAVDAHLCAIERAPQLAYGRFIVSATTPFTQADLAELRTDAPAVVARRVPAYGDVYARLGWTMPPSIDRVYVNAWARSQLGWKPRYDFATAIARLAAGEDPRSKLAREVGAKGYHRG